MSYPTRRVRPTHRPIHTLVAMPTPVLMMSMSFGTNCSIVVLSTYGRQKLTASIIGDAFEAEILMLSSYQDSKEVS